MYNKNYIIEMYVGVAMK